MRGAKDLLKSAPKTVNVGLGIFKDALDAQGAEVVHVEWSPPPKLEPKLRDILEKIS